MTFLDSHWILIMAFYYISGCWVLLATPVPFTSVVSVSLPWTLQWSPQLWGSYLREKKQPSFELLLYARSIPSPQVYRSNVTYPRSYSQDWSYKFPRWPSINIWWTLLPWNRTHFGTFHYPSSCSQHSTAGSKKPDEYFRGSDISDFSPR